MAKVKKNKKTVPPKKDIQELIDSRDGGRIALRGYSYQILLSCYLILSNSTPDIYFQLEGIEDIDLIKQKEDNDKYVIYIQAKCYSYQQDASFLFDVLKNFIEAYLLDPKSSFKLIYDFPVAKGNLSKLFESQLDEKSRDYWRKTILEIQNSNNLWNWSNFDFDQFLSHLSFEKIERASLESKLEKALIEAYEINTDNIRLFANGIKIFCLDKARQGGCVLKSEIDILMQSIRNDISKGCQNPAHSWIRRVDFSISNIQNTSGFLEGKKPTPADIASKLPVRRVTLEQNITQSIQENTVTVIKASSGQGKTTLALQVAYNLQQEYTPYLLTWCNDAKELGNIIQYFNARIKVGEKPLIIIDNLDGHLSEWNMLAQLLQSEVHYHYKLLVTTRESDWYNYSGDLSNIQSLNIIKPLLEGNEAEEIYNTFKKSQKLHPDITNWQKAWNKVAKKQLLIEYVYLLTHGEMLEERLATQLSEIGKSPTGKDKCEILRKICFADICRIKVPIDSLLSSQAENSGADLGELLKSMESEFLVHVDNENRCIEGLHPVRSMHIVKFLHEYYPLRNTALSVVKIVNKEDYSMLFSHFPENGLDNIELFNDIIEIIWSKDDLSHFISIIQGLFSGSVMQYFRSNQSLFDDANSHCGLFFISTEMCPFVIFKEFNISVDTLDQMSKIFPDNSNIKYLCELRDRIPICNLSQTAIYTFCECLYRKLARFSIDEIKDIESYAVISEWLFNIDENFNLTVKFHLDDIWNRSNQLSIECVSTIMFTSFCGNKTVYKQFVEHKLTSILTYLKRQTESHKLYVDADNKVIHVEYILRLRDIASANKESVLRLKYICRTLPIFDIYCSDAIKPSLNLLSGFTMPDDAHKEMPIRNIVIMFHQNLTLLWNKTIVSNYEFDTITEWIDHWFDERQFICLLAEKYSDCIFKILSGKNLSNLAAEVDKLHIEFSQIPAKRRNFHKEDRPFEEKPKIPEGLAKIKNDYFQSVQNFNNQFPGFLCRDPEKQRLAMYNLTAAQSELTDMQVYFTDVAANYGIQERNAELCFKEKQAIEQLIMSCSYYQTHSANKFLNKYQIKEWYKTFCRNEMKAAEGSLSLLQSRFSIHFPKGIYRKKSQKYYPVVVDDLEISSENAVVDLLTMCRPFAESTFDYLVILCTNGQGVIRSSALQIPNRFLKETQQSYKAKDTALPENMMLPHPVEVTAQMLNCFVEEYSLPVKESDNPLPIGDIAEELWVYSKSRELLTDPEDADYLTEELQVVQSNVEIMLHSLENKIPPEDIDRLSDVCKNVFDGDKFNDESFNNLIEHYIEKYKQ